MKSFNKFHFWCTCSSLQLGGNQGLCRPRRRQRDLHREAGDPVEHPEDHVCREAEAGLRPWGLRTRRLTPDSRWLGWNLDDRWLEKKQLRIPKTMFALNSQILFSTALKRLSLHLNLFFASTFSPHGPLSSTLSFLSVHLQLAHPTRIRQLNGNVRPFYLFRCVQFLKFYLSNFQLSRAPPQLKSRTSCLYCKPPEHSDVYNHFHCKHK